MNLKLKTFFKKLGVKPRYGLNWLQIGSNYRCLKHDNLNTVVAVYVERKTREIVQTEDLRKGQVLE